MLLSTVGTRALRLPASLNQQAYRSVTAFLNSYVARDGRVIRRDQGGDTVSEGQAYGMLLSVAMDDRTRFDSIWGWTRSHLLEPNGLLASRWADGHVVSSAPASDADLDAAQALVLASERFGRPSYRSQGAKIARAVLQRDGPGRVPEHAAGAGRRAVGPCPTVLNPSYFSPRGYADLARADHDRRWRLLVSSSHAIVQRLIAHGGSLPPNWASLGITPGTTAASATANSPGSTSSPGTIRPIANPADPSGLARPVSSFDAIRMAVRYAESCDPADRRLAAALWPMYRRNPGRDSYALDGAPASPYMHAASLVGAAAAARAAGDRAAATRLLNRAQAENAAHPSYYGSAWVALGRVMLTTAALGSCTS